jgi:hypothetical protein
MKSLFTSLLLLFCSVLQASAQDALRDLNSIDELQKQFNSDAGKVRLVAVLSPT